MFLRSATTISLADICNYSLKELDMKYLTIAIALLSITACVGAAINDIGEDKVSVRANDSSMDRIDAEARKGCSIYGRIAVFVSKEELKDGHYDYLYACRMP